MNDISSIRQFLNTLRREIGVAWIAFLTCAAVLLCWQSEIQIFKGLGDWWIAAIAVAGIASMFAIIINLVTSIGRAVAWVASATSRVQATRKERRLRDRRALSNIRHLDAYETKCLAWVLRRGQRQFRAPYNGMTLDRLDLVDLNGGLKNLDLWIVRQIIWDRRSDILDLLRDVPDQAASPFRRGDGW